ncbi:hypothetical protein BDZ89DRAFT_1068424 [Hymenopellis radicata]|nr:hypothetical protein BDZ89DRAFT_1068424 [Hymenopellis radicata]
MPITFIVTPELKPRAVHRNDRLTSQSASDLLTRSARVGYYRGLPPCAEFLQSSITDATARETIPQHNGFVDTVVKAYSSHHDLVIRPEDLWLAIIVQFSLYVNAHSEEMREHFVTQQGVKTLTIMAPHFTDLMVDSLKDKDLKNWVLPAFTTTTTTDTIIASVVMMATLKSYYRYQMMFGCGLPSVTLLGEKSDYDDILSRLDRLTTFGDHPELAEWQTLLRPVVRSIADSFDATAERSAFWQRICDHLPNASDSNVLSGWISVFCPFNREGKWVRKISESRRGESHVGVNMNNVAPGFSQAAVKIDDNGEVLDAVAVAGHFGSTLEAPATLSPCTGWFVFIRGEEEKNSDGSDYESE